MSNAMVEEDEVLDDATIRMLPDDSSGIPVQDHESKEGNGSVSSDVTGKVMILQRRAYTQKALDSTYADLTEEKTFKEKIKSECACSKSKCVSILLGYLPILTVLRKYRWKTDLLHDFISGLSVSFMHMPQGLALGLLASLPPVYGLYTTFYPVMVYVVFGTSRHVSMGTNAVIALLTAGILNTQLDKYVAAQKPFSNLAVTDATTTAAVPVTGATTGMPEIMSVSSGLTPEDETMYKVGVAMTLSLISGAILFALGLLRLGFVTSYLSSSFVGGFTTAAAVHICTSQLPKMLNISIKAYTGAGKLVLTYIEIFSHIDQSNPADVIISILSVAFLLSVTILVNERYRKKLKTPVPVDLIIVIIGTVVSYFADLKEQFGIAVVGEVQKGFPAPMLPNTDVIGGVASDAVALTILILALTITMAKLMAKQHDYVIDDNQEFIAYGLCNVVGGFFRCFPSCIAPPRTMILSNTGARSTLNGIFTAVFILVIILVAGQLVESLPIAVLAVMICVAVKNLLLQVETVPGIWRVSKPDFVIWILTFLVSTFADLDIGVIAGIAVSILTVVVSNQLTSGSVGAVATKEDLVALDRERKGFSHLEGIQIFYFPSQIFFANADRFKKELYSKVLNPSTVAKVVAEPVQEVEEQKGVDPNSKTDQTQSLKYIILECSSLTYIDIVGANMMKLVNASYAKVGVKVVLARCPAYARGLLSRAGYFQDGDEKFVFVDIYDAINSLREAAKLTPEIEKTCF